MKVKRLFAILIVVAMLLTSLSFAADDAPLFTRNISRTPGTMTGASSMSVMSLYVPAQDPQGEPPTDDKGSVIGLEYYAGGGEDCTNQVTDGCDLIYTRYEAKPLIITYNDGVGEADLGTGAGFGQRDAFAALSLDDGATWKNVNLSDSALRSSINLKDGHAYPGDVFKLVHQVEGNQVVAAWISRYCESGAPLYSWTDEEKLDFLIHYPELDNIIPVDGGTDLDGYQLYLDDLFTVGGAQKSVDYTAQGFPSVGEIPYGCVWTARGTLEQALDDLTGEPLTSTLNGEPVYEITWRASERLTSGRRDPHQISITSSPGAGFVIFWQEDPAGLRPGKGLGPGEGWSGAIANSKTDIWYTYLDLAHVGDVCTDVPLDDTVYCTPGTLADIDITSDLFGKKPKAAVPFAMPVRITDNNMCKFVQRYDAEEDGDLVDPYCYADFDGNGFADLCAGSWEWYNTAGNMIPVCVAEDGRLMNGQTASTRVRAAMKSYDSDGDDLPDSSWVLFGAEKMKALGTIGDLGCDPMLDPECTVYDIGKNMWYYTFKFDEPALGTQGMMLNAPALSPETGEPFVEVYVDERGYEIVDTEIARRFNLMVNSPAAMQSENTSGTAGILLYKEGILFQGGPADIFTRRIVLPDGFDPAVDNPFDYGNVVCDAFDVDGTGEEGDWLYVGTNEDGTAVNPHYVRGLCTVQGVNVSGTTLIRCSDGSTGEACADLFPYSSTYEEWFNDEGIQIPKVLEWRQCGGGEDDPDGCIDSNLDDPSWVNPYDVSKGHRGFIDGDFVMMMYATAANWKAGTVGNEAYQLYIRRSFDGGLTWTTLPADYTHWSALNPDITIIADGTTSYEWYGGYTEDDYSVEYTYGVGEFEQARNVSQLAGTRVTVLDPRYSPSGGMLKKDYTKLVCDDDLDGEWLNCDYTSAPVDNNGEVYVEEVRDPSGFFATFETGDNSVVDIDTATVPLDMYYSRASSFGDDWDEQDICATDPEDSWYPNSSFVCEEGVPEYRWDWLENGDDLATEASVFGNPNGDRFYTVWNQELPVGVEIYTNMDSEFRRIFFNFTSDAYPWANIVAAVPIKGGGGPGDSMLSASTAADAMPADSIVSASTIALSIVDGDTLTLVGTGRDYDHLGDGELKPMWFDNTGAVLCELDEAASFEQCQDENPNDGICDGCVDDNGNKICDDGEVDQYECEMATEVRAAEMEPGRYQMMLKVMDDEGNWSPVAELASDVWVAYQIYNTYLPLVTR